MAWGKFNVGITPQFGSPILGPDGRLWIPNSNPAAGGGGTDQVMAVTTAGVYASYTGAPAGLATARHVVTDGTYIYGRGVSTYPREYFDQWTTAGAVLMNGILDGPQLMTGQVIVPTATLITVGQSSTGTAGIGSITLAGVYKTSTGYAGYNGSLTDIIYDGTWCWAPFVGSATIFRINPAAVGTKTAFSLPATPSLGQIGWDGTHIYIGCSTGVIVYPPGGTGTISTSANPIINCFYSAQLGLVVVSDSSWNFYTMPAGGGALTLIGNASTITGASTAFINGFCDGPALSGQIYATSNSGSAGSYTGWLMVYPVASTGQLVMPLAKKLERRHWRFGFELRDKLYLPAPVGLGAAA